MAVPTVSTLPWRWEALFGSLAALAPLIHTPGALRYLKAALFIGTVSALAAIVAWRTGVLAPLDLHWEVLLGIPLRPVSGAAQFTLILLSAVGIAWATVELVPPLVGIALLFGVLAEVFIGSWMCGVAGIHLSPFPSVLAALVAFFGGSVYRSSPAGQRKRLLRQILGNRVSRETMQRLISSNLQLPPEPAMRPVAVVVLDADESREPGEGDIDAFRHRNRVRDMASGELKSAGGYLLPGRGRQAIAVFGALNETASPVQAACLAIEQCFKRLGAETERHPGEPYRVRIGCEMGECLVGVNGTAGDRFLDVDGEAVEMACELATLNRNYGSLVLSSQSIFLQSREYGIFRPVDLLPGPEAHSHTEIYELLGSRRDETAALQTQAELFWKAVIHFRRGEWEMARAGFLEAGGEADPVIHHYLKLIPHGTSR